MDIKIGDKVRLKDRATNNAYLIIEKFYNVRRNEWAKCENIITSEISEHPILNLEKIK